EQVIAHNVDELFRGMEVVGVHPFRVTRNADLKRDEEEADDLLELISDELRERRFASVVRLEIDAATPERTRRLLLRELALEDSYVYEIDGLINLIACHDFASLNFPELRFRPWEPVNPLRCNPEADEDEVDVFRVVREKDVLVHLPYESFGSSVQRFVEAAAADPHVLAIKQTLYRTSSDSGVMKALISAAEDRKSVV